MISLKGREKFVLLGVFTILIAGAVVPEFFAAYSGASNSSTTYPAASVTVANNQVPPMYATVPSGKFFYASSEDFAPPGQVDVYLVGWTGCHVALSDGWPLYIIMSGFGQLNYTFGTSNPYRPFPNTTGLIFTEYQPYEPNEPVHFYYIYLYNKWMNETANCEPIPQGDLIPVGANETEHFLPTPLAQLVMHYQLDAMFNGTHEPLAILKTHIVTVLIITGPNGTYMAYGPLYNILPLKEANGQYIMEHIYDHKMFPNIWQGVNVIESTIREAAGTSLNVTFPQ